MPELFISTSEGDARSITLDGDRLGLSGEAKAADLETGEAIERVGPGRFAWELKKHDFRILRVE